MNPQFVSRQLGHANPAVTMEVYSHLFARREHGELARQALEASYAAMTSNRTPVHPYIIVFVSRQLGHASPAITLRVYAHLFEQADHAVTARDALEASYAAMASASGARPPPVSAGST